MPDNTKEWWLGRDGFNARNGGWIPTDADGWIARIENSHKGVKNLLGSEKFQIFAKLEQAQLPIPQNTIEEYFNKFETEIPGVLKLLGIEKQDLAIPSPHKGTHSTVKTSKAILNYVQENHSGETNNRVTKIVSDLGQEWAKYRTGHKELEICLGFSPRSFILLGHYGPDKDSCFRQGSTSPKDKYIFAQSQDTFVITISQEEDGKRKNKARALGFMKFNPEPIFNISNVYFGKNFTEGDFVGAMKLLVSSVLKRKTEEIGVTEETNRILGNYDKWEFYNNPSCRYTFHTTPVLQIPDVRLQLDLNKIIYDVCRCCGKKYIIERMVPVEEEVVCSECYRYKTFPCELTGERCFERIEFVCKDRVIRMASSKLVQKIGKCCEGCKTWHEKTLIPDQKCQDCSEMLMDYCDECEQLMEEEKLTDLGETKACAKCLDEMVVNV